jgi:hypothetical protein
MAETCFGLPALHLPCLPWRFIVPTIFLLTEKKEK